MAITEKTKRIVAVVIGFVVVVMAYNVFSPMISGDDGHRSAPRDSASGTGLDRSMPLSPDAPGPDMPGATRSVATAPPVLPVADNSPATSQTTPDIISDKPATASGPVLSAEPSTAQDVPPGSVNNAPARHDVDTLLSQAQMAELNAKLSKFQSETKKALADADARVAEAQLAEIKAHAEAHYIGTNPDRYAQQTMKTGGLEAPGLPALTPFSSGQQVTSSADSDSGPILRLISGEGKERFAVVEISGVSHSFRVGTKWAGYILKSIHDDSVDVDRGGKTISLSFDVPRARPMQAGGQTQSQQSRSQVAPRIATPGDSTSMALGYSPGHGATVTPIGPQGGSQRQQGQGGGESSDTAYGSPGY